jgi:hypothetical protein
LRENVSVENDIFRGVGYEERRNQKYLGQEAVFGANGYIYFGSAYFFCMEKAVLTVNSL